MLQLVSLSVAYYINILCCNNMGNKVVSCHGDIVTRGESGSGKSHVCEKLMVEILKREKVTALWTKELFKVEVACASTLYYV